MKKIFELKEQQIKIIQQVMNEKPECNTEAAALRYIIESYDYEKSEAERITKIVLTSMEKILSERLDRLEYAVKETEKNSHILIDVINTILFQMNINHLVSPGAIEHDVITESKKIHEKSLRKKKQYKDNKREK